MGGSGEDDSAKDIAGRVLKAHRSEMERISGRLPELMWSLRQIDREGWRREGRDLVCWMRSEADAMDKVEKNVAITKVTGGSASIVGGVMTGVGIVASLFTFGLAAPLVVAGVAVSGAGAATSAVGGLAELDILCTKTRQIKKRCEAFGQRTEGLLIILQEMGELMSELWELCQQYTSLVKVAETSAVAAIVLKSCMSGWKYAKVGTSVYRIAQIQMNGVIFGAGLRLASTVSKALLKGAGAAVGIGFGIWEVVDASGTLQNGGSHASLIRDNATQIDNTVKEIDKALHLLDL